MMPDYQNNSRPYLKVQPKSENHCGSKSKTMRHRTAEPYNITRFGIGRIESFSTLAWMLKYLPPICTV